LSGSDHPQEYNRVSKTFPYVFHRIAAVPGDLFHYNVREPEKDIKKF
jgi:hypothetical protein